MLAALTFLEGKNLPVTDRELSILAVAVTVLQQRGIDADQEPIVIQADPASVVLIPSPSPMVQPSD